MNPRPILAIGRQRRATAELEALGRAADFVERIIRSRRLTRAEAEGLVGAAVHLAAGLFPGAPPTFATAFARRLDLAVQEIFGAAS